MFKNNLFYRTPLVAASDTQVASRMCFLCCLQGLRRSKGAKIKFSNITLLAIMSLFVTFLVNSVPPAFPSEILFKQSLC